MEWLGSGHTLIRRDAYERAGGFSDFFLHRSTVNEDVDLGLKLGRVGRMFCAPPRGWRTCRSPAAAPPSRMVAEDDLFNRYSILRYTQGRSRVGGIVTGSDLFRRRDAQWRLRDRSHPAAVMASACGWRGASGR